MKRALALAVLLAFATPARAQTPVVQVVFMTAEWCPNCAALRPELDRAITRVEGAARIDMDVTNSARRAQSREIAAANNVLAQHDAWIGRTGFAAIVDAATHRTLGCVTAAWSAPEIEGALRTAVWNARHRGDRNERRVPLSDCPD
ncbi:MAG: thioredoxin domain-containing protein [Alphaproteobacteria bacterium]|nr:thioredoxin domain-containing protein [Alphaproteobacteria bacterium]